LEDNCPMVVLEAMAAGVPVIAANVGGVPDLVEDGVTGLLCDPTDPKSMAAAVYRFMEKSSLREAVAGAGQRMAQTRFHPTVIAGKHLEIYREVLNSRS
jgi:L-malate glycosyltransferase